MTKVYEARKGKDPAIVLDLMEKYDFYFHHLVFSELARD